MFSTEITKKSFLCDDFLLDSEFAKLLYHQYAKHLPILDYHNHLSPKEIAENKQYKSISEVWLAGDHYKWRAMRTLGIDEKYITGDATDLEKFQKWAETVPYTLRNPLYHWTHLELRRYFGIEALLSKENASDIYYQTSEMLQEDSFRSRGLLQHLNVEVVCSTDDPIDSLEYHKQGQENNISPKLFPAFRPDKAFAVENPTVYMAYVSKLSDAVGFGINNYSDLLQALQNRVDFFADHGCTISDHGLEQLHVFKIGKYSPDLLFQKLLYGQTLAEDEAKYFKFHTLVELCRMYHAKGWVQQFHLGGLRNTNERMLSKLGPDTGFDSIGDYPQALGLATFLNLLDSTDQLTKTILYNLNPSYNEVLATMVGNFNDGSVKGKIQFGSGWWFLDQKDGMEKQLNALSNMGLLSCFVGMLTDSRSFLSFPRHEYFRRVLCNLIGKDVEKGELPADEKWLGKIVSDISYYNAKAYFNF